MVSGNPASLWPTAPSWKFVSSPRISGVLSPRSTAPNHTLARAPNRTSPIRSADGAAQAPSPMSGTMFPSL
jgi:hypothetical protein